MSRYTFAEILLTGSLIAIALFCAWVFALLQVYAFAAFFGAAAVILAFVLVAVLRVAREEAARAAPDDVEEWEHA
ncbi:MAG TPA: hypothetical protein VF216_03040 [Mizugakiibacter sp.]